MARRTMSRRVPSASARNTRSKSRVVCIDTTIRLYVGCVKRGAQGPVSRARSGCRRGRRGGVYVRGVSVYSSDCLGAALFRAAGQRAVGRVYVGVVSVPPTLKDH